MESTVFRVTEYGAEPNSGENAIVAIQRTLEAAKRENSTCVIEFPHGRYDIFPEHALSERFHISNTVSEEEHADVTKTIGLLFRKMKGITVEGNGSLLLFHGKMTMFVFDDCQDIVIRNLSLDHSKPTIAEMTVEKVEGNIIDVLVHPDSRHTIDEGKLYWLGDKGKFHNGPAQQYDPPSNTTWRTVNPIETADRVEELSGGRLRFHFLRTIDTCAGRVYQMRDGIRDEAGIFIYCSSNVTWQDAGIHYMHGLGIVGQCSENLTFQHLDMSPKQGNGRTSASFCDFMHFSGCRGEITVEDSQFKGAHDDAINVHGTHLHIVGRPAPDQIRVRFMHGQTYGFEAFRSGDSIDFVRGSTLIVYASNKVIDAKQLNPRECILTLEQPVPLELEMNDVIENATWTPEVYIRRNHFSRIPTRGILVTTRRCVVIEDNLFERLEMSAILISNDANHWYESGMVRDVLIRRNRFVECGRCGHPVIWIEPENMEYSQELPVHRNIRIEDNTFNSIGNCIVAARSVKVLKVSSNHIQSTSSKFDQPFIKLLACSEVSVSNNVLEGQNPDLNVVISSMSPNDVEILPGQELIIRQS
ncbi:right-handed parallel beta-helix repeat-containing protein [Paenibacillus dokdonensis]|uniref:right-handed parallel beta-helix repeat-containing protein n=1 Tax=Paenibacillus dokdonensis TaxID=2567944 RepID=UPI0010A8A887|nr:right-handed parallel beta-helix repeat-containing protein [Paenibacillus dokdonensis]